MMPSTNRLRSKPSAMALLASPPTQATALSIQPIGASAQANTAWNIRNNTAARITRPATGCMTTASMRSSQRVSTAGSRTVCSRISRTWRWVSVISSSVGGRHCVGAPARVRGIASSASSSGSAPPRCTPTVATTGTPSRLDSFATSISMPRRVARSLMLSASSIGIPRRRTSSTRRRFSLRLVASVTHTSTSGTCSPASWPKTTSRVTASSALPAFSE